MYIIVDTHAFLWYLTESPQLSKKARDVFRLIESGEAVAVVSAVVLLETIDILDKKKIAVPFELVVARINQSSNFLFSEIDWSLILAVNDEKGINDIHDRILIAVARVFDAPIISRDRIIRDRYQKVIW